MNDPIPFLNFTPMHDSLADRFTSVFQNAVAESAFIGGPTVSSFEEAFADYCEGRFSVGVGSGTDALRFALIGAGVGAEEIVLTVPNTFIATTEAITQAGAQVDFVDIDEQTYNLSAQRLQEYLEQQCDYDPETRQAVHRRSGKRVSAVIPVHLYGQPVDMDKISAVAEAYGLRVVEDACQAHGAAYFSQEAGRWMRTGSLGCAAAFSFYPGKNLGAFGEAGAVVTCDASIAERVRILRNHGQAQKYIHLQEGYNGRLDAIQAGVLHVKLPYLDEWNAQRRAAARRYDALLANVSGVTPPLQPSWAQSVYHLYVVRLPKRESVQQHLTSQGIGSGLHYPVPLHLQKAYAHLGYGAGSFPVSERVAEQILSLPMFPGITEQQQERVVNAVAEALDQPVPVQAAASA
jgi:dTDP-4-amino-4,6-dideoxygalactose transaminase